MKIFVIAIIAAIIIKSGQVIACEPLVPNEIQNLRIQSIIKQEMVHISLEKEKERSIKVNHEVKGRDVYIECLLHDFTFTKEKVGKSHQEGEGHLILYVDGHKIDRIFQPSFIVKGLPTGKHTIKLELFRNDQQSYDVMEEITVQIH